MEQTKFCHSCRQYLPYGSFYTNKLTKDGLFFRCKGCQRTYTSQYRSDVLGYKPRRWVSETVKYVNGLILGRQQRGSALCLLEHKALYVRHMHLLDDFGVVKPGFEGRYSAVTCAAKSGRATTHGIPKIKHVFNNGLLCGLPLEKIIFDRYRHRIRKHAERVGLDKYRDVDQAFCRLNGRSIDDYFIQQFGYAFSELQLHLAKQFRRGMDWLVFSSGAIHIDHKTPLIAFDLSDPSQIRNAYALGNLQLLWDWENSKKGALCDITGERLKNRP